MNKHINFARDTNGKPFVVAGPCSAETEEQTLAVAEMLKHQTSLFRAGLWKPRTRPGTFEGVGSKGLPWLKEINDTYNIPVATEVANANHAEQCLRSGIDALWIGARTTVNPFTVQEIADAIRGTGIPVLIKNPVNPDLKLWIGATERIMAAGSTNVAAIHRGFSTYANNGYRNPPMWDIPLEMKRQMPELPLLCDPSHICGNRDSLAGVSQKAIDLNFDGLMVETHHDPDNALSDSQQQITPEQLSQLLDGLTIRRSTTDDELIKVALDDLREIIDSSDLELIQVLQNRMEIVERIAEFKRDNNITIFQQERWDEIMRTRTAQASRVGLSIHFIEKVLRAIHQESIGRQTDVMNR